MSWVNLRREISTSYLFDLRDSLICVRLSGENASDSNEHNDNDEEIAQRGEEEEKIENKQFWHFQIALLAPSFGTSKQQD